MSFSSSPGLVPPWCTQWRAMGQTGSLWLGVAAAHLPLVQAACQPTCQPACLPDLGPHAVGPWQQSEHSASVSFILLSCENCI